MADISTEDLKNEIHAILKTADLNVVSAKKVREQVEKKLKCSLLNRKKELTDIVMDFINEQQDKNNSKSSDESEESESEEVDSEKEAPKKKKGGAATTTTTPSSVAAKKRKSAAKKKKWSTNASGTDSDSDGDSDSDYEQPKAKKTKKKNAGAVGASGRKSTGFTRAYTLSPELASLVGAESMPRHEVVKKVWALIKERQLYDPKNKQYAICDDELIKVMKVKRFRTFGMLKHLKPHFID